MLYRKKRILAKIESTYGTDPTPDGTNAILTRNCDIPEPYGGSRVSRNLDREVLGNDEEINVDPRVQISFEVELAGSGAAGDAAAYAPLLRACGFAETLTPSTSAEYELVSTFDDSVTIYYIMDGNEHQVTGCRGNVTFEFPRGQLPFMRFTFWGRYATPVTAGSYTIDTSGFVAPLPVNESNTSMTFDAYTPTAESLSIDLQNNVVPRNIMNFDEVIITDRAPQGQVAFEMPAVATKDMFSDYLESHSGVNTGALQLVHGGTAGNIVTLDAPKFQLGNVRVQDSDGVAVATADLRLIPTDTGNDEFKLTLT